MKRTFLFVFSVLVLTFFGNTSLAQDGKKGLDLPEGVSYVTTVEGISEYQLDNGLRFLLFPDMSKPTATVNITYLVGSRHEGYGETGMAHLLEHMVFKGTPNHPDIPSELTEHGARPNGTTWYDRTNYFETFNATDENLKWALDLEADRMVNSYIAKKDLESEMTVVRNEYERGENDPGSVLYKRVLSSAFDWHNYGNVTIGARSDLENVPIERLQAFYRKYYQPDNAVLLVAGKFDPQNTLNLISEYFGKIPRPDREKDPLYTTYTKEPTQDGSRHVELRRVGDVKAVNVVYHTPPGSHVDYAAVSVLDEILTNEPSGRLYKALVETKKAAYQWGFAPGLAEGGYMVMGAEVRKEGDVREAQEIMLATIDDILKNPPTSEEVDRAKSRIKKNWDLSFNDANRVGVFLSNYIAMGDWRLLFLNRDRVAEVTPEAVYAVAKQYLKESNRTTGIFIPEEKPDRAEIPDPPVVSDLVKDYKGKEEVAMGEEFDPSPENIESRTKKVVNKDAADYALLEKETRGDAVIANITLRFGDLQSLMGKQNIASIAASMLDKGTKNYSRQEIQDKLDALKATVRINGGAGSASVRIETDRKNLPEVMDLVMEMLKNPTFPEEEFDKVIEENLAYTESQKSEPTALANIEYSRLMNPYPKGHPDYTMTFDEEIESMENMKLEEVKDFYNNFYGASDATVAIVGDFDASELEKKIEGDLVAWKSPSKYERVKDQYFDVKPENKSINTPDKANAMFFAGQPVQMKDSDPDYPAMVLGNFILGGGFLNSRLATRIRQKEGLSYGVGSWFYANAMDEVGQFGSYAIYAPENVEKLEAAYREEIEKVLSEGFTDKEVEDAKNGWLQSQIVNRSQDSRLAGTLSSNLFLGRDLMWDQKLEEKVKNLTAEEINAAFKKHIDLDKFVFVKAGDFEKNQVGKP
ncbi:MAG: pitrilysin family protein [Saprospiraceae bacterium]